MYTTLSTIQFCSFFENFKVERGANIIWSSNFLVEIPVKFGVLLAVPRNEARKSPRNYASCAVSTCAFDAKTLLKKRMDGSKLLS